MTIPEEETMKIKMKTMTSRTLAGVALLGAAAALAGCGGNGGIDNVFGAAGKFRVVNGISDSTSIAVAAPNLPSDFGSISVNTASGFRTLPPSSFMATVTVSTSSGSQPTATLNNINVSSGQETTAYFPGKVSDNSFATGGFSIQNGVGNIANGNAELTFVNASSNTTVSSTTNGTIDITLASNSTPIATAYQINYRGSTTPTQIGAGSYTISIALDSAPSTVIFTNNVTLSAGARLQIAALNETDTTKNSPIRLLVIPSDGTAPVTVQNAQ
jgi:hypothetical protein